MPNLQCTLSKLHGHPMAFALWFCRWYVADGQAKALEEVSTSDRELSGSAARIGRPEELFGSTRKRKRPSRHRVLMLRGVVSAARLLKACCHCTASLCRSHYHYAADVWSSLPRGLCKVDLQCARRKSLACPCDLCDTCCGHKQYQWTALNLVPISIPAYLLQAWRAGEFNARLWQDMVKFLPASFEGNLTQPRNALVAHSGFSFTAHHTPGNFSEGMPKHFPSCTGNLLHLPALQWATCLVDAGKI